MIKKLFFLLLIVGMTIDSTAQIASTAFIKTTLTDAKTGTPLQTKYEIIAVGKLGGTPRITGKSNSEGKFENLYKPGESYTIYCKPTNGVAMPQVFSARASSDYYEVEQKLAISVLKTGDVMGEWTLFGAGKSTLSSEDQLAGILTLVRGNRGLSVTINVSDDIAGLSKGKPVKKPKPSKKSKVTSTPSTDILTDRVNAITAYCTQQSTPEMMKRITITPVTAKSKLDVSVIVKDFKYFGMD